MAAMSLSDNVQLLGRTLGQVLSEQEGPGFLALVEQVRAQVRQVRAGEDDEPLRGVLAGADRECAEDLVRAFTLYFQLVNRAEEHERVRRLTGAFGPRTQTLELALRELQAMGMTAEQVEALIARVDLGLTFTAHPTEMRRRTVRAHLVEVAADIPDLNTEALERIAAHVEALWSTPELRRLRPTVQDEVKGGLSYVHVIAGRCRSCERGLSRAFQRDCSGATRRPTCRSASRSWMGGDRDGNPFVTPTATRDTLQLHRELARELLRPHIREAYVELSQEGDGEETVRAELQALGDAVREREPVDVVARLDALDERLRAAARCAAPTCCSRRCARWPGCSGGTSSASTCASTAR
jgi:phosphoenolpyruvate carboxylase